LAQTATSKSSLTSEHSRGIRSCSSGGGPTAAHDVVVSPRQMSGTAPSTTPDAEHIASSFRQTINVVPKAGIQRNSDMPSETFAVTSDIHDNLVSKSPVTTTQHLTQVITSSDIAFQVQMIVVIYMLQFIDRIFKVCSII